MRVFRSLSRQSHTYALCARRDDASLHPVAVHGWRPQRSALGCASAARSGQQRRHRRCRQEPQNWRGGCRGGCRLCARERRRLCGRGRAAGATTAGVAAGASASGLFDGMLGRFGAIAQLGAADGELGARAGRTALGAADVAAAGDGAAGAVGWRLMPPPREAPPKLWGWWIASRAR